jgi:molecular chaperone GrpE
MTNKRRFVLEELEKELKDCNCCEDSTCVQDCNCCDNCDCGKDCNCTEDDKCCDECTCDSECCNIECETDNEQCESDGNIDSIENECDDEVDDQCACECEMEDDKCKCGCGETVDESAADAYFKQLLSLRAEFDNYRKRTQNDITKAYSNGFNQAITEFLPALDSFKMATEYITDPNTLMGIQYIEKGILSTLEKIGVKAIDVSGKFDPNFHQAIGSEMSAEHESGDIIKECFKGFIMGDKVIHYSQVIVAK